MLQKLKDRLSKSRSGKRQEKIQRRRAMHFEMLEKRILPSADIPVAPQALQLVMDPHQAAVTVAYDPQVMKTAQDARTNPALSAPIVLPPADAARASQATPDGKNPPTAPPAENASLKADRQQLFTTDQQKQALQSVDRVIFIDSRVTDYAALIDDMLQSKDQTGASQTYSVYKISGKADTGSVNYSLSRVSSSDDGVENGSRHASTLIVILDENYDGVDQITQVLGQCRGVSAVDILSHGASGLMTLGSTQLDQSVLTSRAAEISSWGQALTPDGDVSLYGCNIAAGDAGIAFVGTFARVTGADVAASTDATGSEALGGDWTLEYTTGVIESQPLLTTADSSYAYLLQDHVTSTTDETLTGGNGNDNYIFNSAWSGTTTVTDSGATGTDVLDFSAITANLTFTISADGKVSVTDGSNILNPTAGIEKIIGGSGINTFVFEDGASFAGILDGGTGTGVLDYSAYTTAVVVNLTLGQATGTSGIANIKNVTGGAGDDTLTGNAAANTLNGGEGSDTYVFKSGWGLDTIVDYGETGTNVLDFSAITGNLTFTLNADSTVSVTDGTNSITSADVIGKIIGGSGNNTFVFADGADFAGIIDGGAGGTNTLDYSAYTSDVTVNLAAGTATGATSVSNIRNIIGGSGDDTLTGDTAVNTITGNAGADVITGGSASDILIGGAGDDTYVLIGGTGTDTITELAGGGTDALDYSAYTTALNISLSAGTAPGVNTFTNIEKVFGGTAADVLKGTTGDNTFSFKDAWGHDVVVDATSTDSDTLDFSAVNTGITVTFNAGQSVSATDGTNSVSVVAAIDESGVTSGTGRIENIAGSAADDTFIFKSGWGSYTITDAGSNDFDTLDFSNVTVALTFTIHADGTVSVTDGTNTLGASGGIDNIIGGSGGNTFVFEDQGFIDAYLVGGAGGNNILNYSAYTTAIAVDLTNMDQLTDAGDADVGSATGLKGINGINGIIGSTSAGDKLTGPAGDNTWTISGVNAGTINSNFTFTSIENLVGSSDSDDTFIVTSTGTLSGAVNGNPYGVSTGFDTLQFAAGSYTQVGFVVTGQDAGQVVRNSMKLNYAGIESVVDLTTAATKTFDYAADRTSVVTLGGTPAEGKAWTLTVNGTTYTQTPTATQDLTDIANGFAAQLASAGYIARVYDNALSITRTTTGSMTVSATLPAGGAATIETAGTDDSGIVLTRDVNGRLNIASTTDQFSAVSFADPTSALTIYASSAADTITVGQFSTAAAISIDGRGGSDSIAYNVAAGPACAFDSTTAVTDTVAFTGTPVANETWTVTIDGTDYTHTVASGESVTDVLSGLAGLISDADGYAAVAEGSNLIITKTAGGTLTVTTTLAAASTANALTADVAVKDVYFSGTPVAGEKWTVTLSYTDDSDDTHTAGFSHTVTAGETLTAVLADLTSKIDASADYSATVTGSVIKITNTPGKGAGCVRRNFWLRLPPPLIRPRPKPFWPCTTACRQAATPGA